VRNPDADLHGFERLRLVGDEDYGVGLECRDCWDGGRPLGYLRPYPGDTTYRNDPKVSTVDDLAALLAIGRSHLDAHHADTSSRADRHRVPAYEQVKALLNAAGYPVPEGGYAAIVRMLLNEIEAAKRLADAAACEHCTYPNGSPS
jgi:hypothetical protein